MLETEIFPVNCESIPEVIEGDSNCGLLCGRKTSDIGIGVVALCFGLHVIICFVLIIVVDGSEIREGNAADFIIQQVRERFWSFDHLQIPTLLDDNPTFNCVVCKMINSTYSVIKYGELNNTFIPVFLPRSS